MLPSSCRAGKPSGFGEWRLPLRADQKSQRVPPPARDGALQTGRSGNTAGQRPTGAVWRWPGPLPPRRACGTRGAVPGRWPRPDRTGPAEGSSVFQPRVHAVRTFSAACPTETGLPGCVVLLRAPPGQIDGQGGQSGWTGHGACFTVRCGPFPDRRQVRTAQVAPTVTPAGSAIASAGPDRACAVTGNAVLPAGRWRAARRSNRMA